ncbi:VOC family protein [Nocardioides sp.]|uniref:VOC family protein n=1 Tax=Nocardioides sp. TaxID=35761 RepID=UPI00273629DE|nr:VOC family protein [Nocardioides sp.]MDP3893388.1 VOC family protein [Nocardioides sp.]
MSTAPFRLASTVLGTPDPPGLAAFYVELLGWRYRDDDHDADPEWVVIKPPHGEGDTGLSFQLETEHVPPVWPAGPGGQQMQLHLDIEVGEDLDGAVAWAESLGATQAAYQPQDLVRVMLDPAGHPFCLFAPGG